VPCGIDTIGMICPCFHPSRLPWRQELGMQSPSWSWGPTIERPDRRALLWWRWLPAAGLLAVAISIIALPFPVDAAGVQIACGPPLDGGSVTAVTDAAAEGLCRDVAIQRGLVASAFGWFGVLLAGGWVRLWRVPYPAYGLLLAAVFGMVLDSGEALHARFGGVTAAVVGVTVVCAAGLLVLRGRLLEARSPREALHLLVWPVMAGGRVYDRLLHSASAWAAGVAGITVTAAAMLVVRRGIDAAGKRPADGSQPSP
jgi:hypothetical protein